MLPLPNCLPLPTGTIPASGLPRLTLPLPTPQINTQQISGSKLQVVSYERVVKVLGVEDMPNYHKLKLWPLAEQQAARDGSLQGLSPGRRLMAVAARLEALWADLTKRKPLPLPSR